MPLKFPLNVVWTAIELKLSKFRIYEFPLNRKRIARSNEERKREIPSKDQDLMEEFKRIDVDNNGFISFESIRIKKHYGFRDKNKASGGFLCEYVDAKEHIGLEFQRFKKVKQMGDLN